MEAAVAADLEVEAEMVVEVGLTMGVVEKVTAIVEAVVGKVVAAKARVAAGVATAGAMELGSTVGAAQEVTGRAHQCLKFAHHSCRQWPQAGAYLLHKYV